MLLAIYGLRGGHTDTHTHNMHTYPHESDLKTPGVHQPACTWFKKLGGFKFKEQQVEESLYIAPKIYHNLMIHWDT